jgi:hypothetical protein
MAAPHLVGYILLRSKLNLAHRQRCVNVYQCQSQCPHRVSAGICVTEKLRNWFVGDPDFNKSHVLHVFQTDRGTM